MSISNEDIIEAIANKTVIEVVDLIKAMEEKFGVSAAAPVAAVAAGGGEAAPQEEEQTEFDVVLTSYGEKKVGVIKVVRAVTTLGLKEAKELVESIPSVVKEAVSKEEAETVKKQMEEAGASVEIK